MTDRDKGLCCAIKGFMHSIAFRLHSRKFFMHEFRYAKEHAIARTFHKAFRLVERCLLLGLMVAVSLEAQQSSPSAPAWTGVVRTAAGEPVAGAKVTVFTPGRQKESNRSYGNRRKVRDCGPSTRATSRERATARARSDRASGSEYYWRNNCADGIRSKRAVDCSQSANFCGSLEWEPEHNFERSQRNKRGETLQPKGK